MCLSLFLVWGCNVRPGCKKSCGTCTFIACRDWYTLLPFYITFLLHPSSPYFSYLSHMQKVLKAHRDMEWHDNSGGTTHPDNKTLLLLHFPLVLSPSLYIFPFHCYYQFVYMYKQIYTIINGDIDRKLE